MKIAVNGRFLAKPYTGIGQYTKNLYDAMAAAHPEVDFVFFAAENVDCDLPKNCRIVVIPESKIGTSGIKKTYWEQYQVPKAIIKSGADIAHFPYPSNPWRKFAIPAVVTVHDAIPWTEKAYRQSFTTKVYQSKARKAISYSDAVLTVSNYSKDEIEKATGCNSEKIRVVYNAPSPLFLNEIAVDARTSILKRNGINPASKYFLYVGGYDERKNVRTIVDVFTQYIAPKFDVDLVLAGGKSLNDKLYSSMDYLTHVKKESSLKAHKGNIVVTGFISEKELPALYQSSLAFINLSRKEGFDLPLIEAAVSKTPVICSDIRVHREVAGDLPLFVDCDGLEEVGMTMEKLVVDDQYYQKQKQKAQEYVCPYSWKESAKQTFSTFKQFV